MKSNLTFIASMLLLALVSSACKEEVVAIDNRPVAYLLAYTRDDDPHHLYFAMTDSCDFIFKTINGGNPVLESSSSDRLVRDPMVFRDQNGKYHLVATISNTDRPFVMWDSDDMVDWHNERTIDLAPENCSKTWSPEIFYDDKNDCYMIHWTSEVNNEWNTAVIRYVTTTDFKHFTEPKTLFKDEIGILHSNIIKVGDKYKLLYRKNGLCIATSDNAQGPYADIVQLTSENVEGPCAFKLIDGSGYGVIWDYYNTHAGYGLSVTKDFVDMRRLTNYRPPLYNDSVRFPTAARHGCIMPITRPEREILKKNDIRQRK